MTQIEVLSGKMAGGRHAARHFPFTVGRSPSADLRLEEEGVWERHLELSFDPKAGFFLTVQSDAIATLNGEAFLRAQVRNGDSIGVGSVRLRFWLAETRQKGLRLREWLTWAGIILVAGGQIALLYWLVR